MYASSGQLYILVLGIHTYIILVYIMINTKTDILNYYQTHNAIHYNYSQPTVLLYLSLVRDLIRYP